MQYRTWRPATNQVSANGLTVQWRSSGRWRLKWLRTKAWGWARCNFPEMRSSSLRQALGIRQASVPMGTHTRAKSRTRTCDSGFGAPPWHPRRPARARAHCPLPAHSTNTARAFMRRGGSLLRCSVESSAACAMQFVSDRDKRVMHQNGEDVNQIRGRLRFHGQHPPRSQKYNFAEQDVPMDKIRAR